MSMGYRYRYRYKYKSWTYRYRFFSKPVPISSPGTSHLNSDQGDQGDYTSENSLHVWTFSYISIQVLIYPELRLKQIDDRHQDLPQELNKMNKPSLYSDHMTFEAQSVHRNGQIPLKR